MINIEGRKLIEFKVAVPKNSYSHYQGEDGEYYEDAVSFVHIGVLGFCGCGAPWENLQFLLQVLKLLAWRRSPEYSGKYEDWAAREAELGKGIWLAYYFLDREGYTEHGGGVSHSWLTDRGYALLEFIEEAIAEYHKTDEKNEDHD